MCIPLSTKRKKKANKTQTSNDIENSSNLTNLYHNTKNGSMIRKRQRYSQAFPPPLSTWASGLLNWISLILSPSQESTTNDFPNKTKTKPKLCPVSLSLRGFVLSSICYGFSDLLMLLYVILLIYVGLDFSFCFQKKYWDWPKTIQLEH